MATSTSTSARSLRIGAEDLKRRLQSGESATILDTRNPQAWDSSGEKIQGAVRVDSEHFQADPNWPKNRLTVAYCT